MPDRHFQRGVDNPRSVAFDSRFAYLSQFLSSRVAPRRAVLISRTLRPECICRVLTVNAVLEKIMLA